ncbi:MAG: ComF family protein [Patescibacteria group bacterium]
MIKVIERVENTILDAIFPHQCLCGKWGEPLCSQCFGLISKNKTQLCPVCKKLSENGKTCPNCRQRTSLTGVMIFGDHEGLLKDAIWQYKYNFVKGMSEPLVRLLSEKFGVFIKKKQFVITSVPISKNRLNWRGFNQSELLAAGLSTSLSLEYKNLLVKTGKIKPQVGLTRKERIKNLKGKIELGSKINPKELKSKRIIIVDDVYTTGTTLEECAKTLRNNGAREVWGIVLSRD